MELFKGTFRLEILIVEHAFVMMNGEHEMELVDVCMLSKGEHVIFDDGNLGNDKKLVLTNRRLIFLQGTGIFVKTYRKEGEIPIKDIESAHYDTVFGAIRLQLKNGEKEIIDFSYSFEDAVGSFLGTKSHDVLEVRLQATIDRWVNEINRLIARVPEMVYCRYCGAKNKPTETKCVHCGALMP